MGTGSREENASKTKKNDTRKSRRTKKPAYKKTGAMISRRLVV
jgi:hypothetical protein